MDRRRFVPSPEGLEGRALLSSLFGNTNKSLSTNPATDIPVTFFQKTTRVEHLPYYLRQLEPGRVIPNDLVARLESDLQSVVTELHRPNPQTLVNFNTDLRAILPQNTLSIPHAKLLSRDFSAALQSAGATPQADANLTSDMNAFAKLDSASRSPVFLATNDYSVVLQTTLGIGRPIQEPEALQIALKDGIRAKPGYAVTRDPHPRFVGTYGVGNTVGPNAGDANGGFNSNGVTMQIVDPNGNVLGQAPVSPKNGDYVVTISPALSPGVYKLYVRAEDPQGHLSTWSPPYLVKVRDVAQHPVAEGLAVPRGPLGLP